MKPNSLVSSCFLSPLVGHHIETPRIHLPGIVDQDIHAAELFFGGLDQPRDVIGLDHVGHHRVNLTARLPGQFSARALQAFGIAAADHHPHALFQKLARRFAADAAARAGDNGSPALDAQIHPNLLDY